MKRTLPLLLALGCLLATVQAATAQPVDIYSRPRKAERSRTYDALHYRIQLRFDEASKSFWGENTITLTPLRDGFTRCVLDAETFTVTAVTDAEGGPLDFEQPPHQVIVHFPRAYAYGDTLTFTVAYHAENVDVDAEAFGMSASYDLGLDFKDETPENPRLINTLSFPEGARHWFPGYDHPNDRATNEVIATVRSDYQVLSNGRLVSVSEDSVHQTKTFHWSQELPHPTYLFVLVAGPYVVLEDSLGALPINYWVYPKDVADAPRSFARTPEIIAFFNELYGVDFPWIKYDQVTIPGIGGGAESTTATVLGQSTIHDARAHQDFPSEWLVAHEAAHQWWGNLVSYRDWSQIWISESFATFSEYLWAAHDLGAEEGAVNLLNKKKAYLREAHTRYRRPIVFDRWHYPNQNFDRHTYQKGATVLHMLRQQMGEAAFFRALRHFLQKHAYQPVDTHDLMIAIKEATGQNLDWFFEQWIFSPGHPVFEVSYTWKETSKHIRLMIDQVQDTTQGVPIFKTPITIKVVTSEGEVVKHVWSNERRVTFDFDIGSKPLLVRFDEGNHLLKQWTFEKSKEELLYQLAHDDALGRSWAASELSTFVDDPDVVATLMQSAEHDAFWHVRRTAVEQIGALWDPAHLDFLKQRSLDPHSQVRATALRLLGDREDAGLVDFFKRRFEEDDSYVAQAEALRSLGKCGDDAVIPFLEEAAKMASPRNIIRSAAEGALELLMGDGGS